MTLLFPAKHDGKGHRGPSIKYVTLEGEGVREGVTFCDRGRGKELVTSHL